MARTDKPEDRTQKDRAITLLEAIKDYALMDALDGKFNEHAWTAAHAAFVVCDVTALQEIADAQRRVVKFVEADAVFAKGSPKDDPKGKKNGRTAMEKRISILRKRKGTRLYARTLLEANISETPFDAPVGVSR